MFALLVITGFFIGLAGPRLLARAFRHGLEWTLRQQLASAEEVRVNLGPLSPGDLIRGMIKDLTVEGVDFTTHDGVHYQRLFLQSRKLQFDPVQLFFAKELIWRKVGPTRLIVRTNQAALTAWLRRKYSDWQPEVSLTPGFVKISGEYDFELIKIPFSATGRLQRKTGQSLFFLPETIEVGGFTVPPKWTKGQLQELLGSLEFPLEVPFPLELSSFKIYQGYLEAEWREPPVEEVGR